MVGLNYQWYFITTRHKHDLKPIMQNCDVKVKNDYRFEEQGISLQN